MIPEGEVGCKICEKSIYRIFVEHIQEHLEEDKKKKEEIERALVELARKHSICSGQRLRIDRKERKNEKKETKGTQKA